MTNIVGMLIEMSGILLIGYVLVREWLLRREEMLSDARGMIGLWPDFRLFILGSALLIFGFSLQIYAQWP